MCTETVSKKAASEPIVVQSWWHGGKARSGCGHVRTHISKLDPLSLQYQITGVII